MGAVGGDTNTSVVVSVVLRAATMEWWVNMVKVAGKMVMMIVFITIMRIRCIFDPEAKSRMTEKFKAHLKLKVTDENKDILNKTEDEDFMFSWNGISVMFKLMLQDSKAVWSSSEPSAPRSCGWGHQEPPCHGEKVSPLGGQLRVAHLRSVHGEPDENQGDSRKVCRQSHFPHCLCARGTSCRGGTL